MDSTYLTDMSRCQPAADIGPTYRPDRWIWYSYRTADLEGRAVFTGPRDNPAPLTLALHRAGWHRIHVGIHYGIVGHIDQERAEHAGSRIPIQFLRLRLSLDPCWDVVQPEYPRQRQHDYYQPAEPGPTPPEVGSDELVEVYWRTADLTNRSLQFSPWRDRLQEGTCAGVAYVRLVPLGEEELAEYRGELGRPDTRRLMVVNDGYFQGHHPTSESEVRQWLEPMRDSDIALVAWGAAILDQCAYPTRAGCFVRGESPHLYHSLIRGVEPPAGFDHLETAARIAHDMGIELYGSLRASGGRIAPSHLPDSPDTFFHNHPEYWCADENGDPVGHLSLALAPVRRKLIDILREFVAEHSCDGVHFHFNRCYPFVLYENPVVADFQAAHGLDPRRLARDDPRWLEHRCAYVTTFVREVRRMLDEVGASRKRRLGLAVTVMNSLANNRRHGMDLALWIKEGLVDHLMMHPTFARELADPVWKVLPETVMPVQALCAETGCRVYADLYPRFQTAESYRQQALGFYRAQVHGLAVWDYYWRIWRKSEWNAIRRLGHRRELAGWRDRFATYARAHPLVALAGMSMDPRYSPASNG